MTITDLREQVAQVIENELAPDGLLDIDGSFSTVNLYQVNGAVTAARARFREQAVTDYLARQQRVDQDGRAAILSAGVPGAGKSTAMTRRGLAGAGWRVLDADIMKDLILQEEVRTGTYQTHLARNLPDGHPLMARELAALVHQESVEMITTVRNRCLRLGENLVIEGTLAWAPYAVQLLTELAAEDYQQVAIIDVEVSESVALERTALRWWDGRLAGIAGTDPLGGRYTPRAAVTEKYIAPGRSVCATNAVAAFNSTVAAEFAQIDLIVDDSTTGRTTSTTSTRRFGTVMR